MDVEVVKNHPIFTSRMKQFLYIILLISISTSLFASQNLDDKDLEEEREIIVMRKVAHEILRYTGDSTSTLLPIEKLNQNEFQINFKAPFDFYSDSLIGIINTTIGTYLTPREYIVNVQKCEDEKVVFAYAISEFEKDDVVACLGREHENQCYFINVKLLYKNQILLNNEWISAGLSLAVLFLLGFGLYSYYKQGSEVDEEDNGYNMSDLDNRWIGKYSFNYEEQYMLLNDQKIKLTYKEAQLLNILFLSLNKIVERDTIQKAVWEDEGIIVGRSLDMFISKLRKKLGGDPNVQIMNIHGKGYKLQVSK